MSYECEDCGMDFDTTAQLANHRLKFCVHTKNVDKLDQRIQELKRIENDIDFGKQRKQSTPLLQAPPKSVRNAGMEIIGLKRPPSPALSDYGQQRQKPPQ